MVKAWPPAERGCTSRNPTVATVVTVWYSGVEPGEAEGDVADRPGHDDADQGGQTEPQPVPCLHKRTIATDRRRH